jgi:hypothetical protein
MSADLKLNIFTSQQARQNNLIFIRSSPIRIRVGMKFFRFIGFAKHRNLYFTTLILFKDSNNNSSPSRKDEQTGKKQLSSILQLKGTVSRDRF